MTQRDLNTKNPDSQREQLISKHTELLCQKGPRSRIPETWH